MRRYKPPTDPRWHPYRESQPKKGKGFNPSTQSTISLMNCLEASPAKMAIVAPDPFSHALPLSPLSKTTTFLDSKLLIFSTPPQGARTSFLETPVGKTKLLPRRLLECDEGAIGIFLPESSSTARRLSLPLQPAATIDNSPLPSAAVPTPLLEIEITKESLRKVERALQEQVCQGHSRRFPSILTFTHISAKEALELSGVTAMPNRVVQYIHFLPHSVLGSDSQCITNIGIGTRQANAAMELINGMIRKLLFRKKGAPASLSLSAAPQWVPGFEKIRLLESLTYTLKYQDRFVSIKFDMLTLLPISRAEIQTVEKILWEKFTITTAPTLSPTSSR